MLQSVYQAYQVVLRCGLHWKAWAARKAASRAGRRPPVYTHSSARTEQGGGPVYVERQVGPVCMERQVGPVCMERQVGPVCMERQVGPVCMERQVGPVCLERQVGPVCLERNVVGKVYTERNVQPVHDGETVTSARNEVSENWVSINDTIKENRIILLI